MQALMKKAGISAEELEAAKRAKAGNAQVEPEGETAQGDDSDIVRPMCIPGSLIDGSYIFVHWYTESFL